MKKRPFLLLSLLTAIAFLPAQAEWIPRGFCHIWAGNDKPEPPDDMLPGVFYDLNRDSDGAYFSYSKVYLPANKGISRHNNLRYINQVRQSGANNPTNSPDIYGHFTATLQRLIHGKYALLKKFHKYPVSVAASHFYLAPIHINSLEQELKGVGQSVSESDFLPDSKQHEQQKGRKATIDKNCNSWFGIFRGRVIAPRDMTFRFYGAGDDTIAVRFNRKLVLETGYVQPLLYQGNGYLDDACHYTKVKGHQKRLAEGNYPEKKGYVVRKLKSTPFCNKEFLGLTGGVPIQVKKGQAYPIEIIIGNTVGTALYYLLTQEVTPQNDAPLQLFRTSDTSPTLPPSFRGYQKKFSYEKGPNFVKDSDIWKIAPRAKKSDK